MNETLTPLNKMNEKYCINIDQTVKIIIWIDIGTKWTKVYGQAHLIYKLS